MAVDPSASSLASHEPTARIDRPSGHVPALDGIRGLAIIMVMVFHMTLLFEPVWPDYLYLKLAHLGLLGVDLFFVLSGFLITGILYDAKGQDHFFRNFYARRTLRILPLYYAVVFVCLVVLPQIDHPKISRAASRIEGDEIWYWLHLSSYSISLRQSLRHPILDVSWSLSIEEQFYLVWPLLVHGLRRRSLMTTCVSVAAGSLLLRAALIVGQAPALVWPLAPCRLDGLALGAWLAVAARGPGGLERLRRPARYVWWTTAPVLAAVGAAEVEGMDIASGGPWMGIMGFHLAGWAFGALLVLVVSASPKSALRVVFEAKVLRLFGKYSYAMYLFHLPVRSTIRDHLFAPAPWEGVTGSSLPSQLVFYALGFTVTYVLAAISWYCFEAPFLRLKRYFPMEPPRSLGRTSSKRSVP